MKIMSEPMKLIEEEREKLQIHLEKISLKKGIPNPQWICMLNSVVRRLIRMHYLEEIILFKLNSNWR